MGKIHAQSWSQGALYAPDVELGELKNEQKTAAAALLHAVTAGGTLILSCGVQKIHHDANNKFVG